MGVISTLVVALTATTSDFEKGLNNASKQLDRFAGRFEDIGSSMAIGITAPLAALAEESVRFAVEFDEGLEKMGATLGQTRGQLEQMRNSVLALAGATGQGPRELAQGLNAIETSGLRGQQALDVLRVSAKAATVGLGEMKNVSSTLTAAMNAYAPGTVDAAQATSVLLAAVREGRVTGDEFLSSIRGILPLASNLGVSLDQVAAAMAVMTRSGLDAGQASGALRSVMSGLEKPTSQAQEAMVEMGLTAKGLRDELQSKGLLEVLKTLSVGFKDNESALTRVFPNARALGGVLSLLGANAGQAEGVFKSLAGTTAQTLNKAFGEVASGPGFKFHQALSELQVLLIRIGDDILPRLLPLVQTFAAALELATGFVERLSPATQFWAIGLASTAAAIGPLILMFAAFYSALSTVAGGFALAWRVGSIFLFGFVNGATALVSGFNSIALALDAFVPILAAGLGAITGPGLIAFALFAGAAVLIGSKWNELRTDLGIIFDWIADQARDTFLGKIIDYLGRFSRYAADLLSAFGVSIKETVAPAWDGLVGGVSGAVAGAKTTLEGGLSSMLGSIKAFGENVRKAMGSAGGLGMAPSTSGPELGALPGFGKGDAGPKPPDPTLWVKFGDQVSSSGDHAIVALKELRATMVNATDSYNSQAKSLTSATAQSMGAMTAEFMKGKASLFDFVQGMIEAIGKLIAKILILRALTAVGLGGPFAAGFVGSMFADGGRPPMGKVSVVGERGPELFVPDTAGTVVPLDGRMGGSGSQVNIHQEVNISGMDLGSQEAARRLAVALKEQMRSGASEGLQLALQSAQTAQKSSGRAV
jgi:TP901 family phage tail tape measure protein